MPMSLQGIRHAKMRISRYGWRIAEVKGKDLACVEPMMGYLLADLRVLLVAALLPIAACLANDTIDTTFDPCSPLTIATSADTEEHELQSIEEAIVAWDQVLPTQISAGNSSGEANELSVFFDSGDTFFRAIYFDKLGAIHISRQKLAPEDFALAIAHELGHAFGLRHVPDQERASVMNVGNLVIPPNAGDAFAVGALWESCSESR